jgi:proline dehydrogenase
MGEILDFDNIFVLSLTNYKKHMPQEINLQDTSIAYKSLTDSDLKKNYYVFGLMNQNILVKIGTFFIQIGLRLHLPIRKIIKKTIFDIFCGGENIENCEKKIEYLSKSNIGTILDYSVEGESSENSYDATKNEILKTIHYAGDNKDKVPFAVFKVSGIGSVELLEKLSLPNSTFSDIEHNDIKKLNNRFNEIISLSNALNVRILVDAEETWIQDYIDQMALRVMKIYNKKGHTIVFNTYQLYRTAALGILEAHILKAENENFTIGAKIVRGAYMEKERKRAEEMAYSDPINATKELTDTEYDAALELCLAKIDSVEVCIGTHNEASTLKAISILEQKGLQTNDSRVYFAQLLGMCDAITYNLVKNQFNAAKYVPYGPIEAVMPYLFRRANENTSIAGQSSREFKLLKTELKRRKLNE